VLLVLYLMNLTGPGGRRVITSDVGEVCINGLVVDWEFFCGLGIGEVGV
jgi:hypothetical protein